MYASKLTGQINLSLYIVKCFILWEFILIRKPFWKYSLDILFTSATCHMLKSNVLTSLLSKKFVLRCDNVFCCHANNKYYSLIDVIVITNG